MGGGYLNAIHASTGGYFLSFHIDLCFHPRHPCSLHARTCEDRVALAGTGPEVEHSALDNPAADSSRLDSQEEGIPEVEGLGMKIVELAGCSVFAAL